MGCELESGLRDIMDWGRKGLGYFNAGKTQLILFNGSKNTGAIDEKMGGSVFVEKSPFEIVLGLLCCLYC